MKYVSTFSQASLFMAAGDMYDNKKWKNRGISVSTATNSRHDIIKENDAEKLRYTEFVFSAARGTNINFTVWIAMKAQNNAEFLFRSVKINYDISFIPICFIRQITS